MKPELLIESLAPKLILSNVLNRLHDKGPIDQQDLEILSYLKHFHPEVLFEEESKLMYLLGLFYKVDEPRDLLSFSYSLYSEAIKEDTGQSFTPVQASIRNKIKANKYFSFSAPTSAGKSFLFRELIKGQKGDVVIVVPSRALIAEYILAVQDIVGNRKDILVLQFIDDINKKKTSRRIFIVTPERASELFRIPELFNVTLFLYDEAQISEEKIRGVTFDAFVRRADRKFPLAKKIFAHPFIQNPSAQLKKHNFDNDSNSMAYQQSSVGKVYLRHDEKASVFRCFSPFVVNGHRKSETYELGDDVVANKLSTGGTILIYISKSSIYDKSFKNTFERYISLCKPVEDLGALEIISEIEALIGAENKESELVLLMKKGVVVHHGSIPLVVRFLIEKFTNAGFAKLCFATSTLAQGVNMPFDIVWIENASFEGTKEDRALGLKNLIGRAGRSTRKKSNFDYGFVVVRNIKTFLEKFSASSQLSEVSQLDVDSEEIDSDLYDFIDAVKDGTLDDDYNLPQTRVQRLQSEETTKYIIDTLDFLFEGGEIMDGSAYRDLSTYQQGKLKVSFAGIYESSLGRPLEKGEKTILSASITILLWLVQGKTFKEVLALRYAYLTDYREQTKIRQLVKADQISIEEGKEKIGDISIKYSAMPDTLPNSRLKKSLPSRFQGQKVKDFNYDVLVYDTYDFLDKVISFSLADVFVAAFDQYYLRVKDHRAKEMTDYFRYGTSDETEIWLMRYGFSMEEIEYIKHYIIDIDASEILFDDSILDDEKANKIVEHYLD